MKPELNVIKFRFMYAGGDIVDMKVEQYTEDEALAKYTVVQKKRKQKGIETRDPEDGTDFLTLMYEWEEVAPMNQNLGLDVLFFGSFILTLLLAASVIATLPVEWELSTGGGRRAKAR